MIVIFNTNGSIYDAEMADYVQQGSNGANRLQVAYVDSARNGLSAYLIAQRPNGTTVTLPAHKASFDCNGERYQGWEVTITGSFTLYAGVVHCTLNIVDEDDNIIANYPFDVTVNETGNPINADWDEQINVAQYNAFMAMLSGKATINRVESKDELPIPGQRSVLWLVGTDKYDAYAWDPESEEYRTVLNGIYVVGNIATDDISGLPDGQLIYDETTSAYYEKTDVSPYYAKALGGAGVLGAPNILCRSDDTTRTIAQLHTIYGDSKYIVLRYLDKDYLYFSKKVGSTYACVAFDTEEQRFYKASGLSGSALPSAMLVPANKIEIASKAFLANNYVPYNGANADIDLDGHFINNAKTENEYLNHKEDEDNISSVKFVLGNALNLDEVNFIGEGEYPYLLEPNSTILYGGDIYKHITDTSTDLVYAYFNGSVTTQTDGTSLHLGAIIKISKTEVGGVHQCNRESVDIDLYSKDQAKAKFGASLALELNNTNYKLVAKLYNANGGLIDTSNEIDLPLESIVSSATYYDTYTYDGTTYTKVIVITLSTTSVPTIVPVGDLISGLEKEACVEISSSSGTFTEEQMSILALDNASIKLAGTIYHKVTNSYFNSVSVIAEQEQGQYINFVVENNISVTPSTRSYQHATKSIQVYNKDEIDDIVQGLQDGIDANADDIDTLEGDVSDIQGDIDDIDERLDNHDTEIAKLKKDVDYALKYPLLYGQPTTDTEEEVGLTTSQLPATTLPKGLINYVGGMSKVVDEEIVNAPVEKLSSKGFNIWDEEWELGGYDIDGSAIVYQSSIRSKQNNYIKVEPNTTYFAKTQGNKMHIASYDEDKNFISYLPNANGLTDTTFTTPSNCAFIRFQMSSAYGTTYNHDICINLSGTMNGTYKPYQAPSDYPIPSEVQALDGYGLGIDDPLYNYIDFERKKFVKKVGIVDLGTLTWSYSGGLFYTSGVASSIVNLTIGNETGHLLCANYKESSYNNVSSNDKSISTYYKGIYLKNTAYTDAQTFKTALSGVMLIYELATPVETDISEYLDRDFPNENLIDTYQGGEVEFENDNDMGVPYSLTYQYKIE